jgi:hypothetical protein
MAPGDTAVGQIEVANLGDLPLRYALTSQAPASPLAGWLTWRLWEGRGGCETVPARPLAENLTITAGPAVPVLASRRLGVGASEVICLHVTLAAAAPNTVQGLTLRQQFVAVAEHDLAAENPS